MSGIQSIINDAVSITFDRRRIVGSSISRSQRLRTAERLSAQPWAMTVTARPQYRYSESRGLIEQIANVDRFQETEINLANNSNLNYLTAYQGELSAGELSALTVTNFTTSTMTIGGLPAVAGTITSATIVLKQGDFIQPQNSRYPYIVSETVLRGSGSTVSVTTHRPRITSENVTITGPLKIGNSVTWRMVIMTLPNPELVIWDRFNWDGDFTLMERII